MKKLIAAFSILSALNGMSATKVPVSKVVKKSKVDQLGMTHITKEIKFQGVPVFGVQEKIHIKNNRIVSKTTSPSKVNIKKLKRAPMSKHALKFLVQQAEPGAEVKASDEVYWMPKNGQLKDRNSEHVQVRKMVVTNTQQGVYDYLYLNVENSDLVLRMRYLLDATAIAETQFSGTREIVTSQLSNSNDYVLRDYTRGFGVMTFNLNGGADPVLHSTEFRDKDNYWNNHNENFDQIGPDMQFGLTGAVDYFINKHNYSSYNGQGAGVVGYGHFFTGFSWMTMNAFWNPEVEAIFIGDGSLFQTLGDNPSETQETMAMFPLAAVDVMAHEFTHAVVQYTAGLVYQNESGALNESFADIFGTAVEFEITPELANFDIGEDIYNPNSAFGAESPLRSMSNPLSKGHPKCYKGENWEFGGSDHGGVHTNSSVQNHWFYLLVKGNKAMFGPRSSRCISSINTFNGIGMEKAAKIAFRNLTEYLSPLSDYMDAARGSLRSASDLYGHCSNEYKQTRKAWKEVGINLPNKCDLISRPISRKHKKLSNKNNKGSLRSLKYL